MASRPAHFIHPSEVDTWLADSAIETITFHRTSVDAAERIFREGVRIELGNPEATWGQGFYSSLNPDPGYGEVRISVAMRLTRPWLVTDTLRGPEQLELLKEQMGILNAREALLAAGYNGVVAYYSRSDVVVVAFENEQVKIVGEAQDA